MPAQRRVVCPRTDGSFIGFVESAENGNVSSGTWCERRSEADDDASRRGEEMDGWNREWDSERSVITNWRKCVQSKSARRLPVKTLSKSRREMSRRRKVEGQYQLRNCLIYECAGVYYNSIVYVRAQFGRGPPITHCSEQSLARTHHRIFTKRIRSIRTYALAASDVIVPLSSGYVGQSRVMTHELYMTVENNSAPLEYLIPIKRVCVRWKYALRILFWKRYFVSTKKKKIHRYITTRLSEWYFISETRVIKA